MPTHLGTVDIKFDAVQMAQINKEIEKAKQSMDVLLEILEWYEKTSAPIPNFRSYFRCPVCDCTWHTDGLFSVARHELDCWIPALQKAAEHCVEPTGAGLPLPRNNTARWGVPCPSCKSRAWNPTDTTHIYLRCAQCGHAHPDNPD